MKTSASQGVSVILPVYNSEKTVARAIESVLNQKVPGLELLLIDDGSRDGSPAIIQKYKKWIRSVRTKNRGVGAARNLGFRLSKGGLIAFLDSDDEWLPGKITHQMGMFREYPDLVLVGTGANDVDSAGKLRRIRNEEKKGLLLRTLMEEGDFITLSSIVVKREALAKIPGPFKARTYGEDYILLVQLAAAGPFYISPKVFVNYQAPSDAEFLKKYTESAIRESFEEIASIAQKHCSKREVKKVYSRMHFELAVLQARKRNMGGMLREWPEIVRADPWSPKNTHFFLKAGRKFLASLWRGVQREDSFFPVSAPKTLPGKEKGSVPWPDPAEEAGKKRRSASGLSICLAIPTYNREKVLIPTLRRVFALRPRPDEILLIDQTPSYGTAAMEFLRGAQKKRRLRWIRQDAPSLPLARGRAVEETKCAVVVFMDDDVIPEKDLIARHVRNYSDPSVDAVAVRVQEKDKSLYPHKGDYRRWPRLLDPVYFSFDSNARAEGIAAFWGSNFSARVKILKGIGGFDRNYLGAARFEEADVAVRIWKKGGKIVYDPLIQVRNLASEVGGTRAQAQWRSFAEWKVSFSTCYFAFRYYFPSVFFWYMSLNGLKRSVFRRRNERAPWRMAWTVLAYGYSWILAGFKAFAKRSEETERKGLKELREFCWNLVWRRLVHFIRFGRESFRRDAVK